MAEHSFAAFVNDNENLAVVRQAQQEGAHARKGNVREAARVYQRSVSPDVVLVDLDGEQNPMAHVGSLLGVCRPDTVVLATGSENNVALANELYRGGVFLYLPKPLDAGGLRRGLSESRAVQDETAERPTIEGTRVLVVVGSGMGTTTVTALLARVAEELGRYVLCMDLDAHFGALSLAFDTEPVRGFAQALERGDDQALDRLVARVSPRIGLVAHPFDRVSGAAVNYDALPGALQTLSTQAHLVLVRGVSPPLARLLRPYVSNYLVLFEPTPAGLSVGMRWLQVLEGSGASLVVNETRPLPTLVASDQIQAAFAGRDLDLRIPYMRTMARAMALGEPEEALPRRSREAMEKFLAPLLGTAAGARDEEADEG